MKNLAWFEKGGASKFTCHLCGKEPGDVHPDKCPRSRASMLKLQDDMTLLGRTRILWMNGFMTFMKKRSMVGAYNPGLPYVGPGKPWTAGGIPHSCVIEGVSLGRDETRRAVDEYRKMRGLK